MNTNLYIELARMVLPEGLADYYEITKIKSTESSMDITLEEIDNGVEGYAPSSLRPNGFYEEVLVRDFPLRGKKMTFHVKRRRWIVKATGRSVGKRWDLVAEGTRHSREFASFLKELPGQIPDYGPLA